MQSAIDALTRARHAWRAAGCPGSVQQEVLFPESAYQLPEVIKGNRADIPRPRGNRRKKK